MTELAKAIQMGKKVYIPDPDERTRNDPCYLMSSNDVLGLIKLFYQDNVEQLGKMSGDMVKDSKGKSPITEHFLIPIIARSKEMGWDEVKLIGKQLLFTARL